jgi:hypothetical protein
LVYIPGKLKMMKRLVVIFLIMSFLTAAGYSSNSQTFTIQTSRSGHVAFEKSSYFIKPGRKKSGKSRLKKPRQKPHHKREKGTPVIF